jgi:hypothetical protein
MIQIFRYSDILAPGKEFFNLPSVKWSLRSNSDETDALDRSRTLNRFAVSLSPESDPWKRISKKNPSDETSDQEKNSESDKRRHHSDKPSKRRKRFTSRVPSCQLSRTRTNLPKKGGNGRSLKKPYDEKEQFWPKKGKFEQIFQKEPKNRLFLKLPKPLHIGGLGWKRAHLECLRIASIKLSCPIARATQKKTALPSKAIDPLMDAKIDRLPFRTLYLILDSLQAKPQKTTAVHPEGKTAAEHTRNNKHLLQI